MNEIIALNLLRTGVNIFSLQNLMCQADLQVLRRYLAKTTEDMAAAYRITCALDRIY